MSLCKVCNEDIEKYKVKLIIGDLEPPRRIGIDLRYKINAEVCPDCGVMTILGSDTEYVKMLSEGYTPVTEQELQNIDVDAILDEMELPMIHSESKIWVDEDSMGLYQVDRIENGITFDHSNYYKLAHFLLLSPQERVRLFGKCKCPAVRIGEDNKLAFVDGRRRFSLLTSLGANRVPVAVTDYTLEHIQTLGIPYHTSK